MSAHRRSRHLYSFVMVAGILTVSAAPAFAQVLAFGPVQSYQPGFPQYPQYAPQTPPQSDDGAASPLASEYRHQIVAYPTSEPAGTIVIDTAHKFLYLTMGGGKAMRYGIGVGRQGFTWSGVETISRKAEWPDWIPPKEMVARQPYLPRWVSGGPGNPLGARAMYLGNTEYRIHGTNDPSTIGKNVSSGCIRLENSEVEDLYSRVNVGTRVIVLPNDPHVSVQRVSVNDNGAGASGNVTIDRGPGGRMSAQIAVSPLADARVSSVTVR
jgi:lipoprotein-anchoring transpeptidase ErfK/SrfK